MGRFPFVLAISGATMLFSRLNSLLQFKDVLYNFYLCVLINFLTKT